LFHGEGDGEVGFFNFISYVRKFEFRGADEFDVGKNVCNGREREFAVRKR
jgi:hypothetical protein